MAEVEDRRLDLGDLYETHRLSLVRLALLLVDDLATAEDVVQDAFAGLHTRQASLRNGYAALAYLRTSVVNNARSVLRHRRTWRRHGGPDGQTQVQAADSELLLAEEQQRVLAALRALPDRQREVLTLRYWSGLSEAEIADALEISKGSVKSNASRGLDRLVQLLGGTR